MKRFAVYVKKPKGGNRNYFWVPLLPLLLSVFSKVSFIDMYY